MKEGLHLRFANSVEVIDRNEMSITLSIHGRYQFVTKLEDNILFHVVDELLAGESNETDLISNVHGIANKARLCYFLNSFKNNALLVYEWTCDNRVQLTIQPTLPDFNFERTEEYTPSSRLILSRFAYLMFDDGQFVLNSPKSRSRIIFRTPLALKSFFECLQNYSERKTYVIEFGRILWITGFINSDDSKQSECSLIWEFHDLLFHQCSRMPQTNKRFGGTYRFKNRIASPAAIKQPMSNEKIIVEDLRIEKPLGNETIASILMRRQSYREWDNQNPVSLKQLGYLLSSVGKINAIKTQDGQEVVTRPIPSAGSIHEIELYVAVRLCTGLKNGFYHYSGMENVLYKINSDEEVVDKMIDDAARAMNQKDKPPQCLVILSSRMPRIAWKYEGIAYRLTLLNAGVIIQSMYLIANEVNLACSAIGSGNSLLFAKATGIDPLSETSIGEFAIGSRKT